MKLGLLIFEIWINEYTRLFGTWEYGFEIYLVNVKTIRTIAKIFVVFSEKLHFNPILKIQ